VILLQRRGSRLIVGTASAWATRTPSPRPLSRRSPPRRAAPRRRHPGPHPKSRRRGRESGRPRSPAKTPPRPPRPSGRSSGPAGIVIHQRPSRRPRRRRLHSRRRVVVARPRHILFSSPLTHAPASSALHVNSSTTRGRRRTSVLIYGAPRAVAPRPARRRRGALKAAPLYQARRGRGPRRRARGTGAWAGAAWCRGARRRLWPLSVVVFDGQPTTCGTSGPSGGVGGAAMCVRSGPNSLSICGGSPKLKLSSE
ncbi:unnamed protein product, partial [Pelagomonas calceolata]